MKTNPIKFIMGALVLFVMLTAEQCDNPPSSDDIQRAQQEKILAEGTAETGMPSVKNFREKKIFKDVIERRDQNGLATYTYVFSEITGKFTYLGESLGYPISAATQYTNPQKTVDGYNHSITTIAQADPNGLFSPSSTEGSWIVMYDPVKKEALPQYSESRLSTFSYKLRAGLVMGGYKDE